MAYEDLPGWQGDNLAGVLPALRTSCDRLLSFPPDRPLGPDGIGGTAGDWVDTCREVLALDDAGTGLRALIEARLTPFAVSAGETTSGTFTGYYEPQLRGARERGGEYQVPLFGVPQDHVTVDLGVFDASLKGRQVVGRVEAGRLIPYHARGDINGGALDGSTAPLFWVTDTLDAFVLHIQGSGQIILPDGTVSRVGFAGHNGFNYTSIGRWLIDQGELAPGTASFEGIRGWLADNPGRMAELLAINQRYIFFREVVGDGPIGANGAVLTAERSLAIDPEFLPLDVPLWLDAEHPLPDNGRLQRLMMAQDTGNAIKGPIRGDFYWGAGPEALAVAGRMHSAGTYYLLLPRPPATRFAERQ